MKIDRNGKAAIFPIEDFVKLLSVYNSPMHELILRIAFYTGERWGAILQLRVEDVYRDAASSIPHKSVTYRKRTRKGQVTRSIEIAKDLEIALKAYTPPIAGYLFPSPYKDTHITYRGAAHHFAKCLKAAGLHRCGYSTHSTRRTFITTLYRHGVPVAELMKITGHKSYSSLLEYIEVDPETIERAVTNYSIASLNA